MSMYAVIVFVHVVSAIVLVGSTFLAPFFGAGLRRTTTVQGLREWAKLNHDIGTFAGRTAPLVLVAGLYLAFAGDWWGSGWLEASFLLFILAGVAALGVFDPVLRRLLDAAREAPDGPIGSELEALRNDRRMTAAEAYLLPGDLAIVFLMTAKPGFGGSTVTLVVVALAATVLARLPHRSTPDASEVPAT
jgi:uncharacterized membrane protein